MYTRISNICMTPGVTRTDAHIPFIYDAEIIVENDRILYAGNKENAPHMICDVEIDGRGALAMPGLINMHTHTPMTLMRNTGSDLPLDRWLSEAVFPIEHHLSAEGVYAASYLGIMEMLRFGTTCFNDMYFHMDMEAKAVQETGMRAMLGYGIVDFDNVCRDFQPGVDLIENWNHKADDRIRVSLDPHAEQTTTPAVLKLVRDAALRYDVPIHMHINETKKDRDWCLQKYGTNTSTYLNNLGLLDCRFLAAHCVWLDENDMDLFIKKNVYILHNPISNLKLASGIAPIARMLEKGCKVTLGTDGVASNNNLNLWEEIKLMPMLQKGTTFDPTVVSPAQVIAAATSVAAEALGYSNLGMLKTDYLADLILVDLSGAHSTPVHDLEAHLIYGMQGSDVMLTMVNGKVLYHDGKFTTLDPEQVKANAAAEAEKLYAAVASAH